jgi:hypothetical protein
MGMDLSSDYGVRGDAGVLRGGVVVGLRVGMGSSIILQHGGGVIGFEVGEGVVCCAVSDLVSGWRGAGAALAVEVNRGWR